MSATKKNVILLQVNAIQINNNNTHYKLLCAATLRINDRQHSNTAIVLSVKIFIVMLNFVMLSVVMLNIVMMNVFMLNIVMLGVVMLHVIMLSVVVLGVVMPSVVGPLLHLENDDECRHA